MGPESLRQIAWLAAEAVAVCTLLFWFFRLRHHFGLALLYITLGAFQHLQTELATSFYIEVVPGILVSPGSTVLFTATLFAVLLVYIREDAVQARSLIVGVVAANLTLSLIRWWTSFHLSSDLLVNPESVPTPVLVQDLQSFLAGTGMLVIDVLLIIVLYEFFFRIFPRSLFLRILTSMTVVVTLDTLLFVTASFQGDPAYRAVLISGLLGKGVAAVIYSLMLTVFLRWFQSPRQRQDDSLTSSGDVFQILTYRQRYSLLKSEASRDALTGLFNRQFFNDNLDKEVMRAARLKHELCLVIVDIDHFKGINDTHGHQVGDHVIVALADAMQDIFRSTDLACRYGGEEFVIIMPDAPKAAALRATRRLQQAFADTCERRELPVTSQVSFTAGIASYPLDGGNAEDLLRIADSRLYVGKRGGRNRIEHATIAQAPNPA